MLVFHVNAEKERVLPKRLTSLDSEAVEGLPIALRQLQKATEAAEVTGALSTDAAQRIMIGVGGGDLDAIQNGVSEAREIVRIEACRQRDEPRRS